MGTYRVEWDCCGSVTETEAWEPESCPFCTDAAPPAAPAPVVREPLTGDQLWDLWRRRGESPQFIDFVPIVRDVERAHGIGGGGK